MGVQGDDIEQAVQAPDLAQRPARGGITEDLDVRAGRGIGQEEWAGQSGAWGRLAETEQAEAFFQRDDLGRGADAEEEADAAIPGIEGVDGIAGQAGGAAGLGRAGAAVEVGGGDSGIAVLDAAGLDVTEGEDFVSGEEDGQVGGENGHGTVALGGEGGGIDEDGFAVDIDGDEG
jgi:hypothetical protein